MEEIKKDKQEFLKIKLDLVKQFFTTLIVIDAGLLGFLFLNFSKNSLFLNICTIIGVVAVSSIFAILLKTAFKILKQMKELL